MNVLLEIVNNFKITKESKRMEILQNNKCKPVFITTSGNNMLLIHSFYKSTNQFLIAL